MSQTAPSKFDTAEYENILLDAGVAKAAAKAHRLATIAAQEQLVTEFALKVVVSEQTAAIRQAMLDQTRWFVGSVAVIVGIATAIIKLA